MIKTVVGFDTKMTLQTNPLPPHTNSGSLQESPDEHLLTTTKQNIKSNNDKTAYYNITTTKP